jgi:hypothetical protein
MGPRLLALTLGSMLALVMDFPPAASAFHEGGVGYCDGCHDLHGPSGNSEGPDGTQSTQALLRGSDASSTCLRCHAEAGKPHNILSQDGSSFTAGGDFYWLTRSYAWSENGRWLSSPANSHGHNVVAADYGLTADGRRVLAPGGDYLAANLSCVSCHDPHGQRTGDGNGGIPISESGSYAGSSDDDASPGNYRLLGGKGYDRAGAEFSSDAPAAMASGHWRETDGNHVDYGSGMSEWCANCHGDMLGGAEAQHPAGADAVFSDWTATVYGAYLGSGDFSGSANSSYLALVPFERGVSDVSLLDPASTEGPEPEVSNVMCLTCHRAHASAFRSIARWDLSVSFLADSHPGSEDGRADAQNSYYGRDMAAEFGPYQRSLCNKCHAKD